MILLPWVPLCCVCVCLFLLFFCRGLFFFIFRKMYWSITLSLPSVHKHVTPVFFSCCLRLFQQKSSLAGLQTVTSCIYMYTFIFIHVEARELYIHLYIYFVHIYNLDRCISRALYIYMYCFYQRSIFFFWCYPAGRFDCVRTVVPFTRWPSTAGWLYYLCSLSACVCSDVRPFFFFFSFTGTVLGKRNRRNASSRWMRRRRRSGPWTCRG